MDVEGGEGAAAISGVDGTSNDNTGGGSGNETVAHIAKKRNISKGKPLPSRSEAIFFGQLFENDVTFPSKKVVESDGDLFLGEYDVQDGDDLSVNYPDVVVDGDNAAAATAKHVHFFSKQDGKWQRTKSVQVRYEVYARTSIAISKGTVVVGVPNDYGTQTGVCWVFEKKDDNQWEETAKWTQNDDAGGNFGYCVDINDNTVVVGAPSWQSKKKGQVYVFFRGGQKGWSLIHKLSFEGLGCRRFGTFVATNTLSIVVAEGYFCDELHVFEMGTSSGPLYKKIQGNILDLHHLPNKDLLRIDNQRCLAVTPLGNIFVGISCSYGPREEGKKFHGALYYEKQKGDGDQFVLGQVFSFENRRIRAIDVDWNDILVMATSPKEGRSSSSVVVYKRTEKKWKIMTSIKKQGGRIEGFGHSVSISESEAIVGASNNAFAFSFEAITSESESIKFDGSLLRGNFSHEPTFAVNGGNAIVMATSGNSLHFFCCNEQEGKWEQIDSMKIENSDGYTEQCVAISGNTAVLGVPNDTDAKGIETGSVHIFEKELGHWILKQKMFPSEGYEGLSFGENVDIDIDTIAVGAPGSVYIIQRNGTNNKWEEHSKVSREGSFGSGVGIKGNTLIVSSRSSVFAFEYDSDTNSYQQRQENLLDKHLNGDPISASYGKGGGRTLRITNEGGIFVAGGNENSPQVLYYTKQGRDGKYVLQQEFSWHDLFKNLSGDWNTFCDVCIGTDNGNLVVSSWCLCRKTATSQSLYSIYRHRNDHWQKVHELRGKTRCVSNRNVGSNTLLYEWKDDDWRKVLEVNGRGRTLLRSGVAISGNKLLIGSNGGWSSTSSHLFSFTLKD